MSLWKPCAKYILNHVSFLKDNTGTCAMMSYNALRYFLMRRILRVYVTQGVNLSCFVTSFEEKERKRVKIETINCTGTSLDPCNTPVP